MNEQMKPEYQQAFTDIFDALREVMDVLPPEEMFVNGVDASDGMTPEGEKAYMEMLRKIGPKTSQTMEDAVGTKPVGWSHPKRDFWTRPKD